MTLRILLIIGLVSATSVSCTSDNEKPQQKIPFYVEEIIIDDADSECTDPSQCSEQNQIEFEEDDSDYGFDDFADDLRDEEPSAPRNLTVLVQIQIFLTILKNTTINLYNHYSAIIAAYINKKKLADMAHE